MTVLTKELQIHWTTISPLLSIGNESDYDGAVETLNDLLDEVGSDENHPLYGLLDTLGTLVHAYEEDHQPMPTASGADMLQFFMQEHDLAQGDLPEVGSQGVLSEILNGKRDLNVRQIHVLSQRFRVSPAIFI
ncbi:MAG: transcriptional regulator [Anaerolineae bacterium]|nr:transcriptional regulator [Anaerolineae bacterium]MCB0251766.1 transcriptional regulator [Anaerolineae bacterium]